MSSVRRRAWLLEARRQVIKSEFPGEIDRFVDNYPDEDKAHFPRDFKGFIRTTFSSVRRPPLKFKSEQQGRDILGGSLVTVQLKNRPPLFNPLFDDLHQLLIEADACRLWSDYQSKLESAYSVVEKAREILEPLCRVTIRTSDDKQWTAAAQRAARSINGVRSSVFQYKDQFPSVLQSARRFWPECKDIGDCHVLALLAADQAHVAANSLVKLMKDVEEWAIDENIGRRDDKRFSVLRTEMSERERQESWYGLEKLRCAERLLGMAQLAESKVASERVERFQHRNGSGTRGLYLVAKEILDMHGWDMKPKRVWELLKAYEGDDVIDEVTDTEVFWFPKSGSKATSTTYKGFSNHIRTMKLNK